ncbi:MAG: STAS domain-containing protein [Chlorobiaceae bacterium]|nr:STAS domain-containing protein [Chlorobiaceae bacterium]
MNMIDIKEKAQGDRTIVELAGKLDASTTPSVEERLVRMIQEGKKYLVLDFGGVTYLASSGLRMLLLVVRQVNKLEGGLVLCRLNDTMRDTLDITGFLPYFIVVPTPEEAVRKLTP